jgi:hypothetical protein
MLTSKYRRLSSWGTALMPGTLNQDQIGHSTMVRVQTYGSAISRSVSLMMRFGSAILSIQIYAAPPGQTKLALLKFDPVRRRLLEHPAGFLCRHERK